MSERRGWGADERSGRNCYLFCLVCFSICMNISQTVHFQFMILLSPISNSKGEGERGWESEMKE